MNGYGQQREWHRSRLVSAQARGARPKPQCAQTGMGIQFLMKALLATILLATPSHAFAWDIGKGNECLAMQDYQCALDHYKGVFEETQNQNAYNNIIFVYAAARDKRFRNGEKALEMAQILDAHAVEKGLRVANTGWLSTYACAYAELGNFQKAIELQKEVISNAKKDGQSPGNIKKWHESKLDLFRKGMPCRYPPE